MHFELGQKIIDKIRGKKEVSLPLAQDKKMEILKKYFTEYHCDTFIETGTYLGETTKVFSKIAQKVFTIELSKELYEKACEKFTKNTNVKCLQGDSTDELPLLLNEINTNSIPMFWLDGHYSSGITAKGKKNTPILEELSIISDAKIKTMVIMIDDARCFGQEEDYPSIDKLFNQIIKYWPNASIKNNEDIIRVIIK